MGLSSSKTKTQSTTSSTPLDQYAPYITQGLTTAQGVLNDNQANLNQMSQSAYGAVQQPRQFDHQRQRLR